MKITEIRVSAGRTFNNPYEQFSNFRPTVVLHASLADGDDPTQVVRDLQAKVEGLVEDHKQNILTSLRQLHRMANVDREVEELSKRIQEAQARLDQVRQEQNRLDPRGAQESKIAAALSPGVSDAADQTELFDAKGKASPE